MSGDNKLGPMLEDEGIIRFLAEATEFYPPGATDFSVAQQRQFYHQLCAHFQRPRPAGVTVTDDTVSANGIKVPIRTYLPAVDNPPVMLYLHGGGFILGSLESHDDICAEIAEGAGVAVVAVDYRLAPEHPFPAAFDDCDAVLEALPKLADISGFKAGKTIIGGDSAGGNLAAALCLAARDRGETAIRGQVLIYPSLGGDRSRGSYITQSNAPGLSTADIDYYHHIYIGSPDNANHRNKLASPLFETDYKALPPAFLVAARFDPLHDDCPQFADRLHRAGVAASVRDEPLLVHTFLRARHISKAASQSFNAIMEAVHFLAHKGHLPPG